MIGERLEEARKRKNISIREAAEATKIRGDYLLAMEDNSFDIALPHIYIRGFLKNYANFLKLDANKILTDYDAHLLGKKSRPATSILGSSQSQSLGHVEINDTPEADEEKVVVTEAPESDQDEPELSFHLREPGAAAQPHPSESKPFSLDSDFWNENKDLYIKIGIVSGAILVLAILLIILISLIGGKEDPQLALEETRIEQTVPESASATFSTAAMDDNRITLSALDDVTLIVEQTIDRKRLWSGTLNAGESLSLEKDGPVSIRFTNGAALSIEKNGQMINIPQTGVGRTVVE